MATQVIDINNLDLRNNHDSQLGCLKPATSLNNNTKNSDHRGHTTKPTIRETRNRLLSDSCEEVKRPKGILKNWRSPTKSRSVSECVDDLSQIMADLDLKIEDMTRATDKLCPHRQYFDEDDDIDQDCDNDSDVEHDDEYDYENDDEGSEDQLEIISEDNDSRFSSTNNNNYYNNNNNRSGNRIKNKRKNTKCDCLSNYGDSNQNTDEKPQKKSVSFSDRVTEAFYVASKLHDRRSFAKYHFSTRHHPKQNNNNKDRKKQKKSNTVKSDKNEDLCTDLKDSFRDIKQTKSQRARQSKKDKMRKLKSRDEQHDTNSNSSDDQGYSSPLNSFSD